jgi:N-acyl-D-amino-acid deacylase
MDSHGGWIASAVDLARFAVAFDTPSRCKVLNERSIQTMIARPGGLAGYRHDGKRRDAFLGCGWIVRSQPGKGKAVTWHTGSLSGTASLLVRRHDLDGLNWAVLFNTDSSPEGQSLAELIDPLVHRAAAKVKKWPACDLFEKYR